MLSVCAYVCVCVCGIGIRPKEPVCELTYIRKTTRLYMNFPKNTELMCSPYP